MIWRYHAIALHVIAMSSVTGCPDIHFTQPQRSDALVKLASCRKGKGQEEIWTVRLQLNKLRPGHGTQNQVFNLPVPKEAFWIKQARLQVTDPSGTKVYDWPPMHVHHFVCRTDVADPWYDRRVFSHTPSVLNLAGSAWQEDGGGTHESYDLLTLPDGWGIYNHADVGVVCGGRFDDDRMEGPPTDYVAHVRMVLLMDTNKNALKPASSVFWESTTTGQIAYNIPPGPSTMISTWYRAPKPGSFDGDFTTHTHPGGKCMHLYAVRLFGKDFGSDGMHLMTLTYEQLEVTSEDAKRINARKGTYMRGNRLNLTSMGEGWRDELSRRAYSFDEGDIFYIKAEYDQNFSSLGTMAAFGSRILWDDSPFDPVVSSTPCLGDGDRYKGFRYSGAIRTQLYGKDIPLDFLNQLPKNITESDLAALHQQWPIYFGNPSNKRLRPEDTCCQKALMNTLRHRQTYNATKWAYEASQCFKDRLRV